MASQSILAAVFDTHLWDLSPDDVSLLKRLKNKLMAIVYHGVISKETAANMVNRVMQLKHRWYRGAGAGEFTLGRVWYAAVSNGEEEAYQAQASKSRQLLAEHFPELEELALSFAKSVLNDDNVVFREGWAGPGFVIFPLNSETSCVGGSIHIDSEGMPEAEMQAENLTESYTVIIPLQTPDKGGNLRIWNEHYEAENCQRYKKTITDPPGEPVLVHYEVGNFVVINSWRLHQIEGFEGLKDRVCLTFHLAWLDDQWQIWF